jgi:hypothetical protein
LNWASGLSYVNSEKKLWTEMKWRITEPVRYRNNIFTAIFIIFLGGRGVVGFLNSCSSPVADADTGLASGFLGKPFFHLLLH